MHRDADQLAPRVAFTTLGCKVNQSEVQRMTEDLSGLGYSVVPSGTEADIYVVNTCTVTHVADRKSRQMIRRLRRSAPDAFLIVTGCYAEVSSAENSDGADLLVGTADKDRIVEIIAERLPVRERLPVGARHAAPLQVHASQSAEGMSPAGADAEPGSEDEDLALRSKSSRTRAFVKIQDGCDEYCSYCIVPAARGRPRSVPVEAVLDDVKAKLEAGYREIVLTGVNVAKYGEEFAPSECARSLPDLIRIVLLDQRLERLRITSVEPQDFDPRLLEVWSDARLARHFHLPLQSGCDATLVRMGRDYSTAQFAGIIEQIRDQLPEAAISTDLIVGFPGESEAEFAETGRFLRRIGFSKIHIFPYSPRAGTAAATMPDQVPPEVKKERAEAVREIALETSRQFRRSFLGRNLTILCEQGEPVGQMLRWTGLTDNYIRVRTHPAAEGRDLANTFAEVRLVALDGEGMRGEVTGEVS